MQKRGVESAMGCRLEERLLTRTRGVFYKFTKQGKPTSSAEISVDPLNGLAGQPILSGLFLAR